MYAGNLDRERVDRDRRALLTPTRKCAEIISKPPLVQTRACSAMHGAFFAFFEKIARYGKAPNPLPLAPASCFSRLPLAADPEGGSLYFEPHLFFDESELSKLHADVVITPVVQQKVGPFPLVCGGYVWMEGREREGGDGGGGARRLIDE